MELVSSSSEEVKNKARNIRDSGFYEVKSNQKQEKSLKTPLYKVYDGFVRNEQWASSIQILTKKKLLFKAIQVGEQKVVGYFERVLRKKIKKNKQKLESFISSKLFKAFLSADSSAMYTFLQEEGILKKLVYHLSDIQYLLKTAKTPQFKKNELSLLLKRKKVGADKRLRDKETS